MGVEISRWLVALGVVAASVGFTVFGMGLAYATPRQSQLNISYILMGVGIAAAIVGAIVLRAKGEFEMIEEEPGQGQPAPVTASAQAAAPARRRRKK